MGLEISSKEDLKELLQTLKDSGLNEVSFSCGEFSICIKQDNPSQPIKPSKKEKQEGIKSVATASDILKVFSEGVEEIHSDGR